MNENKRIEQYLTEESIFEKTNQNFFSKIKKVFSGKTEMNEEHLEEIEQSLIGIDVSIETTQKIIKKLEQKVANQKYSDVYELAQYLKEILVEILESSKKEDEIFTINPKNTPHVITLVGVNGIGKTTTVAKLANQYKLKGYKVIIGAADTFRAAAIEQLQIWSNRIKVPLVYEKMHTEPSTVVYKTLQKGLADKVDVIIIDTAGRLHNKVNLMKELSKLEKTIAKFVEKACQEVLLVVDATTGQNALLQAKAFGEVIPLNGLVITKLDGTAKGGIVMSIVDQCKIPVKYLGLGESINDLRHFNTKKFIQNCFNFQNSSPLRKETS